MRRTVGALLDSAELVFYGAAGAVVLGGAAFEVGRAMFESGSVPAISTVLLVSTGTVAGVVGDVRRRRFGLVSRVLVGAWLACCAGVVALELLSPPS